VDGPAELAARKAALRRALAAQRRAVAPECAAAAAAAVAARLAESDELARCRRIALYAAAGGELATEPLWRLARARGLPVLWPRLGAGGLEFARCDDAAALELGVLGVRAPGAGCEASALGPVDLVVVPALALDRAGRRLGRGGGHYDRALAAPGARESVRVGVGYALQLVDAVPVGEGDERVDLVVTERELVRTAARKRRP
jgi:5-formyltetrahydrofolate cyclo-ligase